MKGSTDQQKAVSKVLMANASFENGEPSNAMLPLRMVNRAFKFGMRSHPSGTADNIA